MRKIKSKIKALVWSQDYSLIFRYARAADSVVGDGILTKFKFIQAFMVFLVTCKREVDLSKNEGTRVVTTFLQLYVYGDFSRHSRAANSAAWGLIWQNFGPIWDFMVVLVTCKNEEDPIKNKGPRVVTRLFVNFSDAQGQLTHKLVMGSWQNSNSFKLLCCPCYL